MVDARLPDGSQRERHRASALHRRTVHDDPEVRQGSLHGRGPRRLRSFTPQTAHFINLCVRGRLNIVVSGGTAPARPRCSRGVQLQPDDERIVTVRTPRSSSSPGPRVPARGSAPEHRGQRPVAIRDLVRNALRMRPDRIVVGEVRGGRRFDMLQAMTPPRRLDHTVPLELAPRHPLEESRP